MEYNRIVAVTGLPGLYEILGSKTDGAIVRSLEDQSTKFVSSRVHNLSHLESIEVYTVRDNVNLVDVFQAMQSNSAALPETKDNKALRTYFEQVYPDMDFERVYASDLKKMVKWYEVLKKNNVEITLGEESGEEEGAEDAAEPAAEAAPAEAPAKKKSSKKNVADTLAAADEKITLDVAPDEVPEVAKPKRTRKKKSEGEDEA